MNETLQSMLRQVGKTYTGSDDHCHDENEFVIAYSLASIALSLEKIAAMMEANGGYNFSDHTEPDAQCS